ncbi:carboxyl-terminal PDZ ligand of neuronal nitric oxide synthase protein isoform X3 [Suricata suricatta]|uniref:Nitric oxide synthase 1 adaptor protein n=1 Tax=Suricata suricatta TaxID=37032 RepID=A0A673TYY0_SURSU|nr:carboxyl-terminal PDZ ligand of neuronal nitric oxide synthase protein isoform X3 [Suricata suricatta]
MCLSLVSHLLSEPLSRTVDHSMFENLNTALPPKLQPSCSLPNPARPAAPTPGSVEPGGPGLRVGSSQHLKNLGRAVGAKVNDFLRRKEPSSLDGAGAMEVNRTAGARLDGGAAEADGPALQDEFPRLDPPPPITRKRTPRALKTTQDMLISSQPVLSSLEYGTELPPGQPRDTLPAPTPDVPTEMSDRGEALANGEVSLSVPDLIHQDSQDEPKLKVTECRRASSPGLLERNGLKLSLSPLRLAEPPDDPGPPPQARTSSLDNEGPHPDLLSFE